MFDHLKAYKTFNEFGYTPIDSLSKVCNAPSDMSGIYIIYSVINETENIIYIGESGYI